MKFKEFKHEPVEPDTYEASMALNQLMRIGKHAIKLHNMIDDAAEMESWVAKKIDLAGDYVKKVYNYTEGEKAGLYDDGGMTEERTPQEKLAIMSKIEKIKKQSKDLAGDKDKDLIDKNKKILATLTKMLHEDEDEKTVIHSITPGSEKEKGMMQAAIFQGGKRTDVLAATPKDLADQYIKNGVNKI